MALFPRYLTGGLQRAYKRGAENIRSAPIAARVLGAIGVLAVLVAIAFAVVLLAMSNLRSSTDEQVQANRVTASTLRLERVVDELEESLRSFVLTRNDRIRAELEPGARPSSRRRPPSWRTSSRRSPPRGSSPPRRSGTSATYATDYGNPLIAIALVSPGAALSPAASQDGLTRIGEIRRGLATLLAREDRLASARAANASGQANRAVLVGVAALAASGFLLLLVMGYLVRSVAHPVRDVATGAARIASGDFSIRIPQEGPAEIRELTSAFNSMASSVESGRRDLAAPERAVAPERAGEVGADHDRRARAAHAAREHPRLHEPHPPARHRRGLAAPVRRDHPRPGRAGSTGSSTSSSPPTRVAAGSSSI